VSNNLNPIAEVFPARLLQLVWPRITNYLLTAIMISKIENHTSLCGGAREKFPSN
jgi:hypothetical protein